MFWEVLGKGFAVMMLAPHPQSPQKDCKWEGDEASPAAALSENLVG